MFTGTITAGSRTGTGATTTSTTTTGGSAASLFILLWYFPEEFYVISLWESGVTNTAHANKFF